jgi:hypothetical protein
MSFLWGEGLVRGGDFKQSLWQAQNLFFLPVVGALFSLGLRGPKDQRALGGVVMASACFKALLGAYFLYRVARPQGLQPPYVTQHTDTLLFVVAIAIALTAWMEEPSSRKTLVAGVVIPLALFGIVINERRLAYVSLGACLFTVFALSPWGRAKRFLVRTLVLCFPLILAYGVAGWSSSSPLFKPVQAIRTVVAPQGDDGEGKAESSTEFRNMENYNLVRTWMPNPLLGSGFGHPYLEVIKLPDISRFFPAYRFVPHNSILWIFGIGGALGFSAVFLFLAVAVLLAARAYRFARLAEERAAALSCICVFIAFLNQAFGDMGTQSWETVFLVAPAVVLAGKLAVSTGAWPAPIARTRTALLPRVAAALRMGGAP